MNIRTRAVIKIIFSNQFITQAFKNTVFIFRKNNSKLCQIYTYHRYDQKLEMFDRTLFSILRSMLELFFNPVTLFKISLNSKIASHFHLLLLLFNYQYTCRQCSATYIGETKKQLRVRISQHKGISFRTNRPLSSFDSSKIYDHAFDSNHPISDDSFKILSNSTVFD